MFDEMTVRLKRQAKLTGGVFTSLGQEATAVGTAFALEPQDFITPLIRDIGAVLVEAHTYRRKGHAEHDDQSYVPEGEIEFWAKNNDPIDRYERFLSEEKIAMLDELNEIVAEIEKYLGAELAIAETAPAPEGTSAAYNVFDNSIVKPAFKKKVLEK